MLGESPCILLFIKVSSLENLTIARCEVPRRKRFTTHCPPTHTPPSIVYQRRFVLHASLHINFMPFRDVYYLVHLYTYIHTE